MSATERPNILWVCTDQQRYDTVHCLNNPQICTVNLDRLCASGVAFTHAYCQSPVSTPSRASFLTGLYPSAVPANRNGNEYFPATQRVRLITSRLAEVGYDCGLIGKLHLASAWRGQEQRGDDGYDTFCFSHAPFQGIGQGNQYTDWLEASGVGLDEIFQQREDGSYGAYLPDVPTELHQTGWCVDQAIEFLARDREGPWLLSVNPFDPHPPFDAPAAFRDRYDPEELPPPLFKPVDLDVQERLREAFFQRPAKTPGADEQLDRASYYGMIEMIDEQIGRLLEALEETGQRENTLVIFTSDHGEMLGDHGLTSKGCRFYEGAVRVPLIMSWPARFRRGMIADALVELTDIAPTLAEIAGIPLEWTHGKSLLPILTGSDPTAKPHEYVRCEYYEALNPHAPNNPEASARCWATMYRDERYKLVVYHGIDYGELYDLRVDPEEFNNLWDMPAAREPLPRLMKSSYDASMRIADPGPAQIGRY